MKKIDLRLPRILTAGRADLGDSLRREQTRALTLCDRRREELGAYLRDSRLHL